MDEQTEDPDVPKAPAAIRKAIEDWRLLHKDLAVLNYKKAEHVGAIESLLVGIGFCVPDDIDEGPPVRREARLAGLARERRKFARELARWSGHADRAACWLLRALTLYRPRNLPAYLRETIKRGGDPGQLLESEAKNRIGRGAEQVEDYSPKTARALEGEHAEDVAKLVVGGAIAMGMEDDTERARLRQELQQLLGQGRRFAARQTLLKLAPVDADDAQLEAALGGAITVEQARRLRAS